MNLLPSHIYTSFPLSHQLPPDFNDWFRLFIHLMKLIVLPLVLFVNNKLFFFFLFCSIWSGEGRTGGYLESTKTNKKSEKKRLIRSQTKLNTCEGARGQAININFRVNLINRIKLVEMSDNECENEKEEINIVIKKKFIFLLSFSSWCRSDMPIMYTSFSISRNMGILFSRNRVLPYLRLTA